MQSIRWRQHWMLLLTPIALALGHKEGISAPVIFAIAALAIIPVARLIGNSTEHLTHYTGDSVGGLLNAVFGNLPEVIIGVVALKAGLYAMVAASLIGAILFNLLLVLGLCFLLGGLKQHTLEFNARAAGVYSSTMFIAVVSLALPSIYGRIFAATDPATSQAHINVALAVLLLILYGLYLLFMLRTHPDLFASKGGGHEPHESHWSLSACLIVLIGSSVLAALLSEVLVGAVEGTGEALGLSTPFLGIMLLASVGGAAEGVSAVTMARRGRFDLSINIALGSCILIALFVAPVFVFASYLVGPQPFHLAFSTGGVGLLFLTVLIGAIVVASGGSGNWYKGAQLLAIYVMIGLLLYFVPL